jgi:hypothetical protein
LHVRAKARRAQGNLADARTDYQTAAEAFHQSGAYRRASNTWRELTEMTDLP